MSPANAPGTGRQIQAFAGQLNGPVNSAVLCDFQGDGLPEIMFVSSGDGTIWEAGAGGNANQLAWPMALGDERCRNLYAGSLRDTLPSGNNRLWGKYLVTGNTYLEEGDTLTLLPGTELLFRPSTAPIDMRCYGPLQVQGRADAPVILTSASPSPAPGDWGRLRLRSVVSNSIEHCVVEYATTGLQLFDSLVCNPCPTTAVSSSEFRHNEAWGVRVAHGVSNLDVNSCSFVDNGVGGIYVSSCRALQIEDCRFVRDSLSGSGYIYGIEFLCGIPLDSCVIQGNVLDGGVTTGPDSCYWDYGIFLASLHGPGHVAVRRNFINSFSQAGILVNESGVPVTIENNCVRSGTSNPDWWALAGLEFDSDALGAAIVRDNVIFQNCYGVWAETIVPPVLGDTALFEGRNNLYSNTIYVRNSSPSTLKAEMCWWGGQPDPAKFIGSVDYDPWLAQAPASVTDGSDGDRPIYALGPSHPNPTVDEGTRIRFSVAEPCMVQVEIFNILGQRVQVLQSGLVTAGWHEVQWGGLNEAGEKVAAGVYFCRLETPQFRSTRKVVVLR